MRRVARTIADFIRLAFLPLLLAAPIVLVFQPVYFFSLANLGHIVSRERTTEHVLAGFKDGVLSDSGSPSSLIFKGGEQLTECISLGIGLDKSESAWRTAITGAYPVFDDKHECEGLHRAAAGAPVEWQPYFRYWHGYRLLLAPLASAFPLWFIKIVNALLVAGACVWLWRTLRRQYDATIATVFVGAYVFLSDALFIWRTFTHSFSLALIFAGTALFAAALRKNWTPPAIIILAAVLGSLFNFFDFLINPPMMPMLLVFFVLLQDRRDAGLLALAVAIGWYGGYAETWIARWAIAYFAMPESAGVVANILYTAQVRISGALPGVHLVPLYATLQVFLRALNRGGVVIPALALIAILHYGATTSRIDWRKALWPCLSILACIAWFELLSSHTQIHVTPEARNGAIALAIILTSMLISMQRRPSLSELWDHLLMVGARLKLPGLRRWS